VNNRGIPFHFELQRRLSEPADPIRKHKNHQYQYSQHDTGGNQTTPLGSFASHLIHQTTIKEEDTTVSRSKNAYL
jgi:hypothetical protein